MIRKRNKLRFSRERCVKGARNRSGHEERFEEVLARFRDDRKGYMVTEGVTYTSRGAEPFALRHSLGHAKQFDVLFAGRVLLSAGERSLPTKWLRRRARDANEHNITYAAIGQAVG